MGWSFACEVDGSFFFSPTSTAKKKERKKPERPTIKEFFLRTDSDLSRGPVGRRWNARDKSGGFTCARTWWRILGWRWVWSHDRQHDPSPTSSSSSTTPSSSRRRCFYLCPRSRANECREWQGARAPAAASPPNRLHGETAGNRPAINYSLSEIFIRQSSLHSVPLG